MQSLFVNWLKVLGKNHNVIFEGVTSTYAKQTCSSHFGDLKIMALPAPSYYPQQQIITEKLMHYPQVNLRSRCAIKCMPSVL